MNRHYILGSLLFASLAGNLFLGCMELGRQLPFAERMAKSMEEIRALPEPQRADAIAIVKKYRPEVREQLAALEKERQEAYLQLSSKDYNRAAIERQFNDIRDKTAAVQKLLQDLALDLADKLTPEERAKILQPAAR